MNPAPDSRATTAMMGLNKLSIPRLAEILESYNAATREVAAELGAPLIDSARLYAQHSGKPLFIPRDIPHPNQRGHNLEAKALYERLTSEGALARPAER